MSNLLQQAILSKRFKQCAVQLSIVLYAMSLALNCNYIAPGTGFKGIEGLVLGWLTFFSTTPVWAWLANPLIIFAWLIFYRFQYASTLLSYVAFFAAASCLCFDYTRSSNERIFYLIASYSSGYWLWLSACAVTFAANMTIFFTQKIRCHAVN